MDFTSFIADLEISLDSISSDFGYKYLDNLSLNIAKNNIQNWVENHKYHTFPKSKIGWMNVLELQFKYIKIKINRRKTV